MTRLDKNALEWSVFGVALVLVLATFGYLIREAIVTESGPPDVTVTLGTPVRGAGGHLVPVTAENRGATTAEEVRITVRLQNRAEPEDAALVIPYLPRGSHRTGWVVFQTDPTAAELRVVGVAYQAP